MRRARSKPRFSATRQGSVHGKQKAIALYSIGSGLEHAQAAERGCHRAPSTDWSSFRARAWSAFVDRVRFLELNDSRRRIQVAAEPSGLCSRNWETNMNSEFAEEILELIEARSQARPTPMEFEMAYQARVAMGRIRFAIKHTEQFGPQTEPMREAGWQLLDALRRLETVDRRFQKRSRVQMGSDSDNSHPDGNGLAVAGSCSLDDPDGGEGRCMHEGKGSDWHRKNAGKS